MDGVERQSELVELSCVEDGVGLGDQAVPDVRDGLAGLAELVEELVAPDTRGGGDDLGVATELDVDVERGVETGGVEGDGGDGHAVGLLLGEVGVHEQRHAHAAVVDLELHRTDIATADPPASTWCYMHRTLAQLGGPTALGSGQRAALLVRNPQLGARYLDLALKAAPHQVVSRVLRAQALARAGRGDAARAELELAKLVASREVNGDLTGDLVVDVETLERWQAELTAPALTQAATVGG